MKKTLKTVLIVLAVLLILCIAVGIWQWRNIAAVIDAFKYSDEDISTLMTDNDKLIDEALSEYSEIEVRDVDESELKAFEQGEITEEDLVEIVLGNTSLEEAKEVHKEESATKPTESKPAEKPVEAKPPKQEEPPPEKVTEHDPPPQEALPDEPKPEPEKSGEAEIAALIARMYVLKSTYMNKLETMIEAEKVRYDDLPRSEHTLATKQKLLAANIGMLASMETECDTAVNGILSELRAVLKEQGRSEALADSMKKAYENEKQLKKTDYINQFLD